MKKCELALSVAFPWPESVKVAEKRASAGTNLACTLTHHLHSLENAITVGRLLAYFIYCHVGLRGGTDSLSEGSEAETHIISTDTMWLWPESSAVGEAGGSVAQIDREGGNQSGLGEAFNSYNHSLTFGKKKKKRKILDLFTHCNNHSNVLGGGRRTGWGRTDGEV